MDLSFTEKKSIRINFGKLEEILSIPNLIIFKRNPMNNFYLSIVQIEKLYKEVLIEFLEVFFL